MRSDRTYMLLSIIGLLTGCLLSIRPISRYRKWCESSTQDSTTESATNAQKSTSMESRIEDDASETLADVFNEDDVDLAEIESLLGDGPLFQAGDHVIVINPLVAEGTLTTDESPIHAVVQRVAYVQDLDMYAYELDGLSGWYNENWLQFDVYMPKIMRVVELGQGKQSDKRADIDALLDEINDYRRLASEFGDAEYMERIEEIKREIAEKKDQ